MGPELAIYEPFVAKDESQTKILVIILVFSAAAYPHVTIGYSAVGPLARFKVSPP